MSCLKEITQRLRWFIEIGIFHKKKGSAGKQAAMQHTASVAQAAEYLKEIHCLIFLILVL